MARWFVLALVGAAALGAAPADAQGPGVPLLGEDQSGGGQHLDVPAAVAPAACPGAGFGAAASFPDDLSPMMRARSGLNLHGDLTVYAVLHLAVASDAVIVGLYEPGADAREPASADAASRNTAYHLFLYPGGRPQYVHEFGEGGDVRLHGDRPIGSGTHALVLVRDAGDRTVRMWVDGAQVPMEGGGAYGVGPTGGEAATLYVGGWSPFDTSSPDYTRQSAPVLLCELRIWDKALCANAVARLGSARSSLEGGHPIGGEKGLWLFGDQPVPKARGLAVPSAGCTESGAVSWPSGWLAGLAAVFGVALPRRPDAQKPQW